MCQVWGATDGAWGESDIIVPLYNSVTARTVYAVF